MERVRFAPATLPSRIIAVGFDFLLGACAMLIALMFFAQRGLGQIRSEIVDERYAIPEDLTLALIFTGCVGAAMPFLFAIQVARRGATPGKALMSLTVRDVSTGGFPSYARALGREAIRFLHIAPFVLIGPLQIMLAALIIGVLYDMSRTRLLQTWYDRAMQVVIVAPIPERE